MHSCIQDLLRTDNNDTNLPHEDNIEAVCEMLTLAGKKLSDTEKFKKLQSVYLIRLQRYTKHKDITSRIKFLIKDVFDMQKNGWVPRREKFTAKKIDKIWEEAENEMGMQVRMPHQQQQVLQQQAQPQAMQPGSKMHGLSVNDAELFPMPHKFSSNNDWKSVTNKTQVVKDSVITSTATNTNINKKTNTTTKSKNVT